MIISDLLDVLQNQQRVDSDAKLRSCSWEDVMGAIDMAKTKYATKADKNKGRAFIRNRPAMRTIHALCNVIPEENGLSVLRGGLMLTFKVSLIPSPPAALAPRPLVSSSRPFANTGV